MSFPHWTEIASGVPHGSILGPLLLILYVNDRAQWISNRMHIFAVDTKISGKYVRVKTASAPGRPQQTKRWVRLMASEINAAKCNVMHVGHNNTTKYWRWAKCPRSSFYKGSKRPTMNDLKPARRCTAAARHKHRKYLGSSEETL